jgi:hypothetical protein
MIAVVDQKRRWAWVLATETAIFPRAPKRGLAGRAPGARPVSAGATDGDQRRTYEIMDPAGLALRTPIVWGLAWPRWPNHIARRLLDAGRLRLSDRVLAGGRVILSAASEPRPSTTIAIPRAGRSVAGLLADYSYGYLGSPRVCVLECGEVPVDGCPDRRYLAGFADEHE